MAITYMIIGTLLCVYNDETSGWLFGALGVAFIILGVVYILSRDYLSGAIWIIIGVVTIYFQLEIPDYVFIALGVALCLQSLISFFPALFKFNLGVIVVSGIVFTVGLMFIIGKWIPTAYWFFIIIGVLFIANGVFRLIGKKLF